MCWIKSTLRWVGGRVNRHVGSLYKSFEWMLFDYNVHLVSRLQSPLSSPIINIRSNNWNLRRRRAQTSLLIWSNTCRSTSCPSSKYSTAAWIQNWSLSCCEKPSSCRFIRGKTDRWWRAIGHLFYLPQLERLERMMANRFSCRLGESSPCSAWQAVIQKNCSTTDQCPQMSQLVIDGFQSKLSTLNGYILRFLKKIWSSVVDKIASMDAMTQCSSPSCGRWRPGVPRD